ncbi:MAG: hypothetical protein ACOCWB_00595 [Bacteroidota bacterium]
MKRLSVVLFMVIVSSLAYGQEMGYSLQSIDSSQTSTEPISIITVSPEYEHDSIKVDVKCVVKKDAIEVITYKYEGVSLTFTRRGAYSPMLKMNIDASHNLIDIKTIFAGIYFLDIYKDGIKCKTFRVEKDF